MGVKNKLWKRGKMALRGLQSVIPIQTLLDFHVGGQTEFQLDYRVTIRAGGTPYGCLTQAVRELWKRFRGVRDDWFQRDICELEIEELESKLTDNVYASSFPGRRDAITLAQKRLHLVEINKHVENDEREFCRFYGQASAIWMNLGFDREPPTRDRIEQLEMERREHETRCQIALDLIGGGVQPNTVSLIQCLPGEMRDRLLRTACGFVEDKNEGDEIRRRTINAYLSYSPDIPAPIPISLNEARDVLKCSESLHLPMQSENSSPMAAISSGRSNMESGYESARRVPVESV